MSLIVFGVVAFLGGLVCWLGYQLMQQNGRILLRLEAVEEQLAQMGSMPAPLPAPTRRQGLPIGTPAPSFDLPDLNGGRLALDQLRGQHVLLVFFNPGCGYCRQMAPVLAALPTDDQAGRPVPIVVTTGNVAANRQLVEEAGLRCRVLLQEQMTVAATYQVAGTPMGYLIDPQGRIASELAVGAQAILALGPPVHPPEETPIKRVEQESVAHQNGHRVFRGNRSLDHSRINRHGLTAGTPAPPFRLPRIDGGELALEELRGHQVLLVFSDPQCGPCDQLAPYLERVHRNPAEPQVLMVSRGDLEANRAKAVQHGLTFPIVLQRQWEVSRAYGSFGTPMAYLIDEQGIIKADLAVGADAILPLAARPSLTPPAQEVLPMR